VWLDSTFVNGAHCGLEDSVESVNPAFQADTARDSNENKGFQKGQNEKIAFSTLRRCGKECSSFRKTLDLAPDLKR